MAAENTHDGAAREQRRQRPALDPPLLALGGQQPVGQAGRQHAADGGRVTDQRDPSDRQATHDDRLFEMRLGPGFERVLREQAQQRQRTQRLEPGHRGRRIQFGGRAPCTADSERYSDVSFFICPAGRAMKAMN
jgi:hypothetical protein